MPISLTRKQFTIAGAVAILALGAGVVWAISNPGTRHKDASSRSVLTPAKLTAKEQAAAALAYPAPHDPLPAAITIEYQEAKDRTKMTLTLRDLHATATGNPALSSVECTFLSEFKGRSREPGHGELSVRGTLSLTSQTPGVLAPSSPPGLFTADGKTLKAKPIAPGESGYKAKAKPQGSHESLAFHLSTKDLLTIATSHQVSAELGATRITLTPAHLELLREFAARMNPNP